MTDSADGGGDANRVGGMAPFLAHFSSQRAHPDWLSTSFCWLVVCCHLTVSVFLSSEQFWSSFLPFLPEPFFYSTSFSSPQEPKDAEVSAK